MSMLTNDRLKQKLLKHRNEKFQKHLIERSYNTSNEDIKSLKQDYGSLVPVFIYDSFMKGGVDDEHFKDMAYFGPATTFEDQFVLLQSPHDSVLMAPTALVMNHFNLWKGNIRRVQGELYGVPLEHMFWLDKVYDNDRKFTCDYIHVMLHQREDQAGILVKDVLCYYGEIKTWTKPLNSLERVQISGNVLDSPFIKGERVYRAFKHSPIKLLKEDSGVSEADWMQMGFDGYGYGGM